MTDDVAEMIRTGLRIEIERQYHAPGPNVKLRRPRIAELEQERRRRAGVVTGGIREDLAAEELDRIAAVTKQARAALNVATELHHGSMRRSPSP